MPTADSTTKTRILLADDHEMLRAGLRSLLAKQSDIDVVAEADNGREAMELTFELQPEVVVMDVGMPELNGIEATRLIKRDAPEVQVVALSMHSERRFVTGMFGAGASAYVLKSSALEDLLDAVRTAKQGQLYASPEITDIVIRDYINNVKPAAGDKKPALSPREREVLQLIAEGHSSKEISARLTVSVNTVDTHRRRIMEKLDLHTVADLTKYAIREGLTSLDA